MNLKQTLKKKERISLQKEIDFLFAQNNSFVFFPLRILYLLQKPASGVSVSVLISIPKKRIKRAVNRNRLKRLIREAYRQNKASFLDTVEGKDAGMLVAFVYIGNEVVAYDKIENALLKSLQTLKEKIV